MRSEADGPQLREDSGEPAFREAMTARAPAIGSWLARHGEVLAFAVLLAYFAVRLAFLAFYVSPAVPPDENAHMAICGIYAQTLGLPTDSPETHAFGLVSHRPYLYYWLMGRLQNANVFPVSNRVFLRLISGLMSCALVFVGWRWIRLVSADRTVRLLFVVMLTNTLMFTAMCASVSYDALVNLLAAISVYALTRFFADRSPVALVGLGASLLAGALTKSTFLPLAAFLLGALLLRERRRLGELPVLLRAAVRSPAGAAAALACVALLASNVGLYGTNLVRFDRLVPTARQVLEPHEWLRAPNTTRNWIVGRYQSGEIGLRQAVREARAIPVDALRRDTLGLLRVIAERRASGEAFEPLSRLAYARVWTALMGWGIFGLAGHQSVLPTTGALWVYGAIGAWALAVLLVRLALRQADTRDLYWLAVAALYGLVLMQFVTYPTYLRFESLTLRVQGRYLFPVLLPLYGIVAKYSLVALPDRLRRVVALLIALWFLRGDLPWLLRHAAPELLFRTPA